jgi:predicted nucleic acid-binding protein
MAKFFIDTNFFMRTYEGLYREPMAALANQHRFISALTLHITCYVHKIKIPDQNLSTHSEHFTVLPINTSTADSSLTGPTSDFEDNIQLNTCLENMIPTFVTLDKELLKLSHYKNVSIISPETLS